MIEMSELPDPADIHELCRTRQHALCPGCKCGCHDTVPDTPGVDEAHLMVTNPAGVEVGHFYGMLARLPMPKPEVTTERLRARMKSIDAKRPMHRAEYEGRWT